MRQGPAAVAIGAADPLARPLTNTASLRRNEFSGQPRAGFCMMGACQDCWIATDSGERLRACSTFIRAGMQLRSGQEEAA
nr:2Fe-2S iron-sulfur cluster-binding protein [Herbaspirillum sp. B39]